MSTETNVNILNEYEYDDLTNPAKPVKKIDITFQLPDSRILSTTILAADKGKPAEDAAIAKKIKEAPPATTRSKTIKL